MAAVGDAADSSSAIESRSWWLSLLTDASAIAPSENSAVGVAAAAPGDARGERQEAAAGGRLDRGEQTGRTLEADAHVRPRCLADRGGECQEGRTVGLLERLEQMRRRIEARAGELVRALGHRLDERHEARHLAERERRQHAGTGAEVHRGERD